MVATKISELPAQDEVAASAVLPIVQGGTTFKATTELVVGAGSLPTPAIVVVAAGVDASVAKGSFERPYATFGAGYVIAAALLGSTLIACPGDYSAEDPVTLDTNPDPHVTATCNRIVGSGAGQTILPTLLVAGTVNIEIRDATVTLDDDGGTGSVVVHDCVLNPQDAAVDVEAWGKTEIGAASALGQLVCHPGVVLTGAVTAESANLDQTTAQEELTVDTIAARDCTLHDVMVGASGGSIHGGTVHNVTATLGSSASLVLGDCHVENDVAVSGNSNAKLRITSGRGAPIGEVATGARARIEGTVTTTGLCAFYARGRRFEGALTLVSQSEGIARAECEDCEFDDDITISTAASAFETRDCYFSSAITLTFTTSGTWYVDAATYGRFVAAGGTLTNGTVHIHEEFNVLKFGGDPTGTSDSTSAIQDALDAAEAAGGGVVYFPPGTYKKLATAAHIIPPSNVTLKGAGQGISVIQFSDASGSNIVLYNASGSNKENISIRDLTIAGGWQSDESLGTQLVELYDITNFSMHNVEIRDSRYFGCVLRECHQVRISGCYIHRTNGDGIAIWDSSDVVVADNHFEQCDDDAVSCHTSDAQAAPLRAGITITGNTFESCQGVKVLGAKVITVSSNVFRRCYAYAIYVDASDSAEQGNTSNYSVSITNNVGSDIFKRPHGGNGEQYYIRLGGGMQQDGAGAAAPGRNDTGTGTIVDLFGTNTGNFQANNTDTDVASPGGYDWIVSGNIFTRTLPAVTNYSDWGFGEFFGGTSGMVDPEITEDDLNTDGLHVYGYLKNAHITNNVFRTSGDFAVNMVVGSAPADLLFDNVVFEGNTFSDFGRMGFFWPASSHSKQNITIRGNVFDGDPRLVHDNRHATNGSWQANTEPVAIYMAELSGCRVEGNDIKNVCQATAEGGSSLNDLFNNTLRCDPAATGFSTSNKGIGYVPDAGAKFRYYIEECDPTQAGFGKIKSVTLFESTSMPAAGRYVRGHYVINPQGHATSPVGWFRLTTGTGHVLNTDWLADHRLNTNLRALAAPTLAADKGLYATDAFTLATFDLTSFARTLLDDADAAAMRTTLEAAHQGNLQRFTSSGTWTKPSWAGSNAVVLVDVIASGGAGGGGARVTAGNTCSGGGGGGGGGRRDLRVYASLFDGTETVTVGGVATGGLGATSDGNAGADGGVGGTSSITTTGTAITSGRGGGGQGGALAANSGGGGGGGITTSGTTGAGGTGGSGGNLGSAGGNGAAGNSNTSEGAAGGGGCNGTTGVAANGGSAGRGIAGAGSGAGMAAAPDNLNGGAGNLSAGASSGSGGTAPGGAGSASTIVTDARGAAGGGGANNTAGAGGNGADGTNYGAPGGGGGSAIGGNGGDGGDGAQGVVDVIVLDVAT